LLSDTIFLSFVVDVVVTFIHWYDASLYHSFVRYCTFIHLHSDVFIYILPFIWYLIWHCYSFYIHYDTFWYIVHLLSFDIHTLIYCWSCPFIDIHSLLLLFIVDLMIPHSVTIIIVVDSFICCCWWYLFIVTLMIIPVVCWHCWLHLIVVADLRHCFIVTLIHHSYICWYLTYITFLFCSIFIYSPVLTVDYLLYIVKYSIWSTTSFTTFDTFTFVVVVTFIHSDPYDCCYSVLIHLHSTCPYHFIYSTFISLRYSPAIPIHCCFDSIILDSTVTHSRYSSTIRRHSIPIHCDDLVISITSFIVHLFIHCDGIPHSFIHTFVVTTFIYSLFIPHIHWSSTCCLLFICYIVDTFIFWPCCSIPTFDACYSFYIAFILWYIRRLFDWWDRWLIHYYDPCVTFTILLLRHWWPSHCCSLFDDVMLFILFHLFIDSLLQWHSLLFIDDDIDSILDDPSRWPLLLFGGHSLLSFVIHLHCCCYSVVVVVVIIHCYLFIPIHCYSFILFCYSLFIHSNLSFIHSFVHWWCYIPHSLIIRYLRYIRWMW